MGLDLGWLPAVPDWPAAIKALEARDPADGDGAWAAATALARHRLDPLRTARLDRATRALFAGGTPAALATRPVRLAVLGSSTLLHLLPAIRVAALRRDLWVDTFEPDYGQFRQALADPGSPLHRFAPTAVLFAFDAPHLLRRADPSLDARQADAALDETLGELRELWRQARGFGGQVIQQTLLPVADELVGGNEHRLPGSGAALGLRLNARLREAAAEDGVDLLALDARAARDGVDQWHDPTLWHHAKQEVSPRAAPLYGDLVARLLAAAQGRSAKCLVLDLDNTLWGGVIGDDGLDGIVLGQGSAAGEAFAAFQRYAKALAARGVILAVSSKNDEANALEAFNKHPEMVLRRADISAFVANWTDKPTNLRAIATELNIGLDSLVFADDNPFERALVRQELPMVAVPELPDDPARYARCIADGGWFDTLGITDEDRARTGQYRANRERDALAATATDLAGYLASLDMRLDWRRFDRTGLSRVTQLINKTNQFNLTTVRYTEDEVAAVIADPRAVGLQLRLADRFGDNGVIAVVIGRLDPAGDALAIETWLMSCRVLGRRVEEATLAVLAGEARAMGARRLLGRYRATPKNAMVADLLPRLGFAATADEGKFELDLAGYAPPVLPIAIQGTPA